MRKSDHSESEFSGKLALGGQGVLSVENSFEYVGGFKGNKFNGYGVYTSARQPGREQVVKEGVWKDGNLVGTSTERRSK